ncbi:ATP-dependent RNA helicase HrpA [Elongatibacter sediminis]|uniref:ATP-dependent RNA helicase HrpA n=1 Tax=Elongatibacter sediminis TaxID=3119006 RepID=A0AAW9RBW4_9GAMM
METKAAPHPTYDPALPITACRERILAALGAHQVIIVAGETGSGKTTQLPKFCLEAGRGDEGLIGCTQPRRIAAQAMAARVAEELGNEVGETVGYQVRFRDRTGPNSRIKFMTDGILLAESVSDPLLKAYDTLIIDEAHERSLNIDFLLGYLRTLMPRRPDLKLVITSATIDTEKFSAHFGGAPVIEVSGRGYPVEMLWQPLEDAGRDGDTGGRDLYRAIAEAERGLRRRDPAGDILVFLAGEREIREAGDFLGRQRLPHTEILPLYARLSSAEQRRVFHPGPERRIILSTNVAETSLTVPRIRFVIDSGFARISRYSHRSRVQRLPIEPVSQASANQRAGRCGRLGPGVCVRLYSEEDFQGRPEFTEPEILRTSLGAVILRLSVMGLGNVETFPFIDPPAPRMINEAYDQLVELGAMNRKRRPTRLGRTLDRWPVDVRIGRMVIEGDRLGCLEDTLVLASALSIQDPRERPLDLRQAADEAHQRFADEKSDFAGLLRLWDYLRRKRHEVSGNQFRKLCRREFLSWQRVLEWFDLYQQLRDLARENRMRLRGKRGSYEQIHLALLSGLLSHVGLKHPEGRDYQGARGRSFHIFPGSGLFGRMPRWIMAAEIVETSRPWGRTVADIRPEWIERQGAHLLKRHTFDPHWSRKRGAVFAWEQVSLYGLVVVEKRRVDYARIDPEEARRIFLLEALVRGELDTRSEFLAHNSRLREEVEELEHKRRRRDVLADEQAQFDFFDARVPQDVCSARSLERWLGQLGEAGRKRLYMGHDVLMREDAAGAPEDRFPDSLEAGGHHLPLTYRFEPGHEADGVTVRVPLEQLNTLDAGRLQWLVPGLLRDKLIGLMRTLKKSQRRSLTPVPVFADALLDALGGRTGDALLTACAEELQRMTGMTLGAGDFDEAALPAHLRMRVEVVDQDGELLAAGHDLAELQASFGEAARKAFMAGEGADLAVDGAREWTFGELPERTRTPSGVTAWPALVDQGDAVGLRLFDQAEEAAAAHAQGVLRLLALNLADKVSYLRRHHGLSREAQRAWRAWSTVETLADDLAWSSLALAAGVVWAVRDLEGFDRLADEVRSRMGRVGRRQSDLLNQVLPKAGGLLELLAGRIGRRWPEVAERVRQQLDDMIYSGFLTDLMSGRLEHYPRYLDAIAERLRQLEENPARDSEREARVEPFWQRYVARLEAGKLYDEALDDYRWKLEEYRVSVFAQQLGTAEKVSPKRLESSWARVCAADETD